MPIWLRPYQNFKSRRIPAFALNTIKWIAVIWSIVSADWRSPVTSKNYGRSRRHNNYSITAVLSVTVMNRLPVKARPSSAKCRLPRQLYGAALLLVVLCLILLAINLRELRLMHEQLRESNAPSSNEPFFHLPAWDEKMDYAMNGRRRKSPVVWVHGQKVDGLSVWMLACSSLL